MKLILCKGVGVTVKQMFKIKNVVVKKKKKKKITVIKVTESKFKQFNKSLENLF